MIEDYRPGLIKATPTKYQLPGALVEAKGVRLRTDTGSYRSRRRLLNDLDPMLAAGTNDAIVSSYC